MQPRSLLSMSDLSVDELNALVKSTGSFKERLRRGPLGSLHGSVIGLYFEKPSTRTRASFEVATVRLGGYPLYLSSSDLQTSRGEPVKDTARMLGGYVDALVGRVYSHEKLREMAKYSSIPIINGLSDLEHPTQVISDLFTIEEQKGRLRGLTLAFIGDGGNVCNSLMLGCSMLGMNVAVASPKGYSPHLEVVSKARSNAREAGSTVIVVQDPVEAVSSADVVYTDVWVSMGEEKEREKKIPAFRGFEVDSSLFDHASKDAVVMHCLPAHRGLEIADDVIEGEHSIVWRQGVNKLYGAAAVLAFSRKTLAASSILKRRAK